MVQVKDDFVAFRIAKEHKEKLKVLANQNGLCVGSFARFLLLKYL